MSSNPSVVTVDGNGLATAIAPGRASITGSWTVMYYFYTDAGGCFQGTETVGFSSNVTVRGVSSITLEEINSSQIQSPIDNNPSTGGGKRIFPDKRAPGETIIRNKVRVKATTPLGANVPIYFKSYDIDDPSTNEQPVDFTGADGNDNRGNRGTPQQMGILSQVGATGTSNSISVNTDASGIARVDLTVTMQPGDNFKVVASTDQAYLNGVVVNAANGVNLRDAGGNTLPTARAKVTDMLTVWRMLHIEVDSMGKVTGNNFSGTLIAAIPVPPTLDLTELIVVQPLEPGRFESGRIVIDGIGAFPTVSNTDTKITIRGRITAVVTGARFTVYDDDDFDSGDGTTLDGDDNLTGGEDVVTLGETLSLMLPRDNPSENVFAAAYIKPVYDGGGSQEYENGDVIFNLNVDGQIEAIRDQVNAGRNSTNESDDFWVVYIQMAYQPDIREDKDRNMERATGGYTPAVSVDEVTNCAGVPRGGQGSLIFLETIRDRDFNESQVSRRDWYKRIVPHEVGHQFGLEGDSETEDFKIMNDIGALRFDDRHLNVLRCRVKSPGQ